MRFLKTLVMLVFIIVVASFAMMNSELVTVNYHFGKVDMALSLLLLLTFVTGMVLSMLFFFVTYLKLNAKNSRLNWQLKKYQKEDA